MEPFNRVKCHQLHPSFLSLSSQRSSLTYHLDKTSQTQTRRDWVSEWVKLLLCQRNTKMASCSATSTTLLSSTPKAFSSTNPISQTLTIPKSFNGLRKPLQSQPSRSISLTSRSHSRRTTSFVVKASVSVCHFLYPIFLYILFVNYTLRFVLDSFNFLGS